MVRINADVKQFEKGMSGFQQKIQSAGKQVSAAGKTMTTKFTAPVIAAGAAVVGLMTKYGYFADELLDASAITGLSTDEMQKWRKLAVDAGVDLGIVTKSVETFNKQLERGNELSPRLAKGFDTMNVSVEDFKKLEPDEQMRKIIGTMMELEEAEARAFANQMNMPDLLPIIGDLVADGRDLDEIMSEIDVPFSEEDLEQMNEFRKEWDNLKESLFMLMGQALQPLFELFSENKEAIQEQLMPAVEGLVEKITMLFEWFSELNPETQKMIGIAIGLALALGPVLMLAGALIGAIGALVSPIGLVVVAIIAFIAIGVALWKNWDKIKAKASEIWGSIKKFFSDTWQNIKGTFNNAMDSIRGRMSSAWEGIKNAVRGPANSIIGFANGIINAFERMINSVAGAINRIPKISIPDWVPVVGGKSFGLPRVPTASFSRIPLMDTGGLVKGPGVFQVGAGVTEVVRRYDPNNAGEVKHSGTIIVKTDNQSGFNAAVEVIIDSFRDPRVRRAMDQANYKQMAGRPIGGTA